MAVARFSAVQRYSGLLGVIVIWTSILIGMSRAGLGLIDGRPISHLGVDRMSAVWFSFGLLLSAGLFVNFGAYVARAFEVKNRFLLYLVIGQIGQSIAAISPYGMHSPERQIHTISAFVLAFSLPFLMRAFARSQSASHYFMIYIWLLRLEILLFIVGMNVFIFTQGLAPLGQALPAVGFHVWIIVLTIISIKSGKETTGH